MVREETAWQRLEPTVESRRSDSRGVSGSEVSLGRTWTTATRCVAAAALFGACAGGTSASPDEHNTHQAALKRPVFEPGEAVAYRILDGEGRKLGRVHSTYDRERERTTVVTRVALGPPVESGARLSPDRTIEYATTLSDDMRPVSFKRLSSEDGRMTLTFSSSAVSRATDISTDEIPLKKEAQLLPKEDLVLLALAVARSGLQPGQSGKLEVRTPDSLDAEEWPVTVYANADRETIVQLPSGKAILGPRGQIEKLTGRGGRVFERLGSAGEPPDLLPLPKRHRYVRPGNAGWVDEEIVVQVKGGQLAGVLSVPRLRSRWKKADVVPGVVFLSDLTRTNRHGFTGGADYGTWQIFDHLADQGFAVLRLDDRGVGDSKSSTPPEQVTADLRLQDAVAMVEAMRRQPAVDPDRIFVIGRGWGGVDALRLAAEQDLTGVVLLGTPFRSPAEVLGERAATILGIDPTGARVEMKKVLEALAGDAGAAADANGRLLELYRPFGARIAGYAPIDVKSVIGGVKEPVAVFQGFKDFEVSWRKDAKPLVAALGEKQAKLFVYEFVDHLMKQESGASEPSRYRDAGRRIEPDVLKDLVEWMTAQARE